MKKILIMPDSFKGSLTAGEFCRIARQRLKEVFGDRYDTLSIPMADGGEGTADCFLALDGFERICVTVHNAYMETVPAYYALRGDTAVIELAQAASLPSVKGREDPARTTTYGVGDMIADAVKRGVVNILLGLGGSCTNDAGCGMARALGTVFKDSDNNSFLPTGGTLDKVCSIDTTVTEKLLDKVKITAMCDVNNPLFGENGAAYIFAPQKGASPDKVRLLDDKLRAIADLVKDISGEDLSGQPGAGAAGGTGFGVTALLKGELKNGTALILDTIGFDELLEDTVLILTGEGNFDAQSLSGKTVMGIADRAKKKDVPVVVISGGSEQERNAYNRGVSAVYTTSFGPQSLEDAKNNIKRDLKRAVVNTARLIDINI